MCLLDCYGHTRSGKQVIIMVLMGARRLSPHLSLALFYNQKHQHSA